MELLDGMLGHASKIDPIKIQQEFGQMLAPGERVEHAYQLIRDYFVFTAIAKHRAVEPLQRLHARQTDIASMTFDELLSSSVKQPVFRFGSGHQPQGVKGSFRRLMRDSGLLKSADGQNRTLYSLRHTYVTMALLEGMDINTLNMQMGNRAAMIEKHYSKLTATMAAERLA